MNEAFAYVDPGSGFVFLQNTSFFWGWLLFFFALFLIPIKFFLKRIKKNPCIIFGVFFILLSLGIITAVNMYKQKTMKKVIILGIDAMDPAITEQLIGEGRLPNFARLKEKGSFSLLSTSNPAESAVAWSSFFTGLNPGGHGIFDFVMRDPEKYSLYLSLNDISSGSIAPKVANRVKGESFWSILGKNKIPSYVYFCPNTFPAEKIPGKMISGMGVPDLLGLSGKFSYYTSLPLKAEDKDSRGRIIHVEPEKGVILSNIYGPKIMRNNRLKETEAGLKIVLNPAAREASIDFQNTSIILKEKEWSGWQKLSFDLGLFKKASGIARFYLKSVAPDFKLYMSPVNFDPRSPLFSISSPHDFAGELADKNGLFYTQGMPHDTWALSEDRLSDEEFLELADEVFNERKKILFNQLENYKSGLFFFYFDTLDALQHMFWRYMDEKHLLYESDSPYKEAIFNYYEKIDLILGEVLARIDSDTVLVVLSDHGFGPFYKSAHVNSWLRDNGFLALKNGRKEGKEFFEDVDWAKTSAYALGFGGIYLNLSGREKYGIVDGVEAQALKRRIKDKLKDWRDEEAGEPIVKDAYFNEDIFSGPYAAEGPDLFIGFRRGYRASWQTALGAAPEALIEINKKKWSGDHLVDPGLVKGVIFANRKIKAGEPSIIDIAPTVLGLFGVDKPRDMQG
ncbi:MAG: hypothetical protein COV72_08315, partial [Candidatus Omnitrophica bacterium CG11_big_fil_rev_8_21_14_0_20_42_13]